LGLTLCCLASSFAARGAAPATTDAENAAKAKTTSVRKSTSTQLTRPAGDSLDTEGRALDLALSPDRATLFVKTHTGLLLVDTKTWQPRQFLKYSGEGGSWHGLALSGDGQRAYVSGGKRLLFIAQLDERGEAKWQEPIAFGPANSVPQPIGLALSADETKAFVCLGISNTLAVIDLPTKTITRSISVGICPYDVVLSPDGKTAYVSNFGGRHAKPGETTENSAGTAVPVNKRSIPLSGTVSVVDLARGREAAVLEVGLHPAGLALTRDGRRLFVANANDDSVSIIDTAARKPKVLRRIPVRPDPALPFGSLANAVALSADEQTLFVANAGNNAIAVCDPRSPAAVPRGFIPTGWFPGGVLCDEQYLYVANVKGGPGGYRGSVNRVALPGTEALAQYTRQALEDAHVPQALRAFAKGASGAKPVPVPARTGAPSVIKHVVYVIKENRTYDQVLGDLPRGNNDPKLCVYGREVTPNHHALAEQFGILDNYYCNGVISSDGHAWAVQGITTDYREKDWGAVRSYDFGTDPLCYANCNFLWDSVLLHGLSFRNYGECDFPKVTRPGQSWFNIYDTWKQTGVVGFEQNIHLHALRQYSSPAYPGWNLDIPDQFRADVFLRELADFERQGEWPSLIVLYLPNDHTRGKSRSAPTQRAFVADNDLALGRCLEGITRSRFWPETCVFVTEDDPQDGYDHVDGHRSLCLVVSPYTKHGAVVSDFYNQTAVLHTLCRMLGLAPMNQIVAQAPTMEACFNDQPDLAAYSCRTNLVTLDERMKPTTAMTTREKRLLARSEAMDFTLPDKIDEALLNRLQWEEARPGEPYPARFTGAHGRGLAALGLQLAKGARDDD
jgi:YVTN family beta-propeller protein